MVVETLTMILGVAREVTSSWSHSVSESFCTIEIWFDVAGAHGIHESLRNKYISVNRYRHHESKFMVPTSTFFVGKCVVIVGKFRHIQAWWLDGAYRQSLARTWTSKKTGIRQGKTWTVLKPERRRASLRGTWTTVTWPLPGLAGPRVMVGEPEAILPVAAEWPWELPIPSTCGRSCDSCLNFSESPSHGYTHVTTIRLRM